MASSLLLRMGLDLSPLTRGLARAENRLKRFGFRAERIGQDLTTRVSLPIAAIGVAAVRTFAQFDKLEKGLSAVTGSAAEGSRQFTSLLDVVKDTRTTLDLRTAASASLQLQAVGQSAARTENLLRQLGIAATVSGSSADDVGEVGRQLAQAAAKGNILQQELRIILERIPALAGVIKNEFGTVTAEGLREAGVSADEFLARLTSAIEGNERFQNVQGGLAKAIETFGIELQIAGKTIGETIATTLNLEENLGRLSDIISRAANGFKELNPETQKFIVFASGAAASIGPLALGMGALARALPLLRSGFGVLASPIAGTIKGFQGITKSIGLYRLAAKQAAGTSLQLQLFTLALGPKLGELATVMQLSSGRAILMGNAFRYAGRALKGLFLNPVGLAIAAIALLVGGIVSAYRNSEFFRQQLDRVRQVLLPVTNYIADLAEKYFPNLKISLSSVGDVFNVVFAVIAGGISFIVEQFIQFIDTIKFTQLAIERIFDGDFSGAADAFSKTLFNPATFIKNAKIAGNSAATVFNQTLDGKINNVDPGRVVQRSVPTDDSDLLDDSTGGGAGGVFRRTSEAVEQLKTSILPLGGLYESLAIAGDAAALSQQRIADESGRFAVTLQAGPLQAYSDGLQVITEKQLTFGNTFDGLQEKINATQGAINTLIEDGFFAQSAEVVFLTEQLAELQKQYEEFESLTTVFEGIGSVVGSAFDKITSNLEQGKNAFKDLARTVVFAARDIIASQIRIAVTTQITKALASVPFPFNVALAGVAGAAVEGLIKSAITAISVPFLAQGGITTGPGLFVAGEAGPEAIIPLDRLHEFMGGGGQRVHVTGRLVGSGDQLIAVIDSAMDQQNRSF